MDPIRRNLLATGAAATAMAATSRVLAQQAGQGGAVYSNGPVRIHYEESGAGFPLLAIAGGGLNSRCRVTDRRPSQGPSLRDDGPAEPTDAAVGLVATIRARRTFILQA